MEWDNKSLYLNNPTTIPYKVTIYIFIYSHNVWDLEAKCTVHDLSNLYPEIRDDIYITFSHDYVLTATVNELKPDTRKVMQNEWNDK